MNGLWTFFSVLAFVAAHASAAACGVGGYGSSCGCSSKTTCSIPSCGCSFPSTSYSLPSYYGQSQCSAIPSCSKCQMQPLVAPFSYNPLGYSTPSYGNTYYASQPLTKSCGGNGCCGNPLCKCGYCTCPRPCRCGSY